MSTGDEERAKDLFRSARRADHLPVHGDVRQRTRDREAGEAFLAEWATEYDLADVDLRVETGDVEAAIERAAADATMVVFGATERGLLRRLVSGSLVIGVIDDVDCSVLLAERARKRSLRERLFGLGKEKN